MTERSEDQVDELMDLFLSGSYATGDYYAGSDIALLLAYTQSGDVKNVVDQEVQSIGD